MTDPTEELRVYLDVFCDAHQDAQQAREGHATFIDELAKQRLPLVDEVAAELDDKGKPRFSNQERREAEVERRLTERFPKLVASEAHAAQGKREAQATCERAEEQLKTLRVILSYRTAELHVEAERVRASTVISEHELLAGEAQALIHGDIPYQTVRMTGTSSALGYDPDLGF